MGVLGITLGGGVGRYQGIHGLMLDALLSVRIVTASGDLIEASSTSNSDLFWGLRGAGANFGAITEATYRVSDLTNGGEVRNADLIFAAGSESDLFKAVENLKARQPKELACIAFIHCGDSGEVNHHFSLRGSPALVTNDMNHGRLKLSSTSPTQVQRTNS